ncbi:hypothetical protein KZ483_07725 [Paenibacillus sp. sptzw28]|uniref:hypothetical protein n=1 Tax=Paenibacillus sp. sptzw28 TaxID=715179 RepID=UPI001C6ECADA|nr:hypothetical protein [Paenibacillus sp. sptzw28]QYR22817.1 hypothetical protein KZ483_07725 [Paenibacillus sp. sptzw28]
MKGGESQVNLLSALLGNRTRLWTLGAAAIICFFCFNLNTGKAEAADGGLISLGDSIESVLSTGRDLTNQKPAGVVPNKSHTSEKPIQPVDAKQAVPLPKADVPAPQLITPARADDTIAKTVANVTGIAAETTDALTNTAAKTLVDVSDTASKSITSIHDTTAQAVSKLINTASKPSTEQSVIAAPKPSKNREAAYALHEPKLSKPTVTEGQNKRILPTQRQSTAKPKVNGNKRPKQSYPKSLPVRNPYVPAAASALILQAESHSSGSSPRDNGGPNSYGKLLMIETPLLGISLPQYTGQLLSRRDIGINQWSQPPPGRPPKSTSFSQTWK